MENSLIVFQLIASLLSIGCFCSEIGVPVLLWQQKTDSHLFDSKSTVNQIDGKVLAEDYLTNSETIVAFVQNRLSLEQFTAEEEERLTAVKSLFKNQLIKPTLLIDVLNPTQAFTVKHFQRQQWDGIHVKNGDKVWVQLPEDSLAENNQLLTQLMDQIQKNVSKNTLFLITGRQNEFQSIDLEAPTTHILKRKVRQAEATTVKPTSAPKPSSEDDNLIEAENCLYLYTTSLTLNNNTASDNKPIAEFDTNITHITNIKGRCWNLTAGNDTSRDGFLQIEFTDKEELTKLTLKLIVQNEGENSFWGLAGSTAHVISTNDNLTDFKTGEEFSLIDSEVSAEQWFGYSCGRLTIGSNALNITGTNKKISRISLTFSRFQFQPFANRGNSTDGKNDIFSEAFDCQVWMTVPLWMGLITLLVMIMILSIGVYFLAIVNTPDRFENPKGKPLVISAIED